LGFSREQTSGVSGDSTLQQIDERHGTNRVRASSKCEAQKREEEDKCHNENMNKFGNGRTQK